MPIYEYVCNECAARFERLVRQIADGAGQSPECPRCSSDDTRRVMSTFAQHGEPSVDAEAIQAERSQADKMASITPKEQIQTWRAQRNKNT